MGIAPNEEQLYDIVAVRQQDGGTIRHLLAGPFDEIDARWHQKRLKAISPDQTYIVVLHYICQQCEYLALIAPSETRRLTEAERTRILNKLEEDFHTARDSGDSEAIAACEAEMEKLSAEAEKLKTLDDESKAKAKAMSEMNLVHTCSKYYNEAEAVW